MKLYPKNVTAFRSLSIVEMKFSNRMEAINFPDKAKDFDLDCEPAENETEIDFYTLLIQQDCGAEAIADSFCKSEILELYELITAITSTIRSNSLQPPTH